MNADRICDLGVDVRDHVFNMLDDEPELSGLDCGNVAQAVEDTFIAAMHAMLNGEQADKGRIFVRSFGPNKP